MDKGLHMGNCRVHICHALRPWYFQSCCNGELFCYSSEMILHCTLGISLVCIPHEEEESLLIEDVVIEFRNRSRTKCPMVILIS